MNENYHRIYGTVGVSELCGTEREEHDYYATSPEAAEWLLKLEILSANLWEPACGEGHLSKVFEKNGFNVRSTDLIDRGYGEGGVDFLQQSGTFRGDIITNPPFKYADEFILKALEILEPGRKLCIFQKLQFLEGTRRRRKIYDSTPPARVWVSSSRIQVGKNGDFTHSKSMLAYAWFVWEKGHYETTELKWFN